MKADVQFKPTKEHRPVRVIIINKNSNYCEMIATIKKDDNEIRQIGPKSQWKKLLQKQPEWVRILVSSITYESLEEIVDMIKYMDT